MSGALAGRLHLHPGTLPSIGGGRADAARLAVGRAAGELPALLGALFTLCAHAHRFTARRAVAAALGQHAAASAGELQTLRAATARDQLLRIAHDWPHQLGRSDADAGGGLRSCPLWRQELSEADRLQRWPDWLAHHWLGTPLPAWLAALDAEGGVAVDRWLERTPGLVRGPAALLRALRSDAQQASAPGPSWLPLADPQRTMPALAAQLGRGGLPLHEGVVPDTGPWSRQHDAQRAAPQNAWMRFVSRFVDLLRLAAPDGAQWLAHGALPVGAREGIAWTEMARGLLVHWVRLDAGGSRVEALRVLAPTDLNFHAQGGLARALGALRASGDEARARLLAVAFDPCVEFDVAPPRAAAAEAAHA